MKGDDLIGKEVMGFEFSANPDIGWNSHMNKYIGTVGRITNYHHASNDNVTYCVKFGANYFWYPAVGIEEQFIEKEPEKELSIDELVSQMKNLISQI
jgi:hypothetical protein